MIWPSPRENIIIIPNSPHHLSRRSRYDYRFEDDEQDGLGGGGLRLFS